ncbi:rhomboid domain-containing protein 2-like [Anomaloglossus baeobatrachus]
MSFSSFVVRLHRLLTYIYFHEDLPTFICSCLIAWYFGGGFEENMVWVAAFSLIPPESLFSRVDQMVPFRVLKRVQIWRYIPATSTERTASQTRKINPLPGSYPTQQYYTPPQSLPDTYSPYHHMKPTGTWPPAGASVYPTGAASGQLYRHGYPEVHTHSNDANVSLTHTDLHSQKDLGVSSYQPELQQVQTQ